MTPMHARMQEVQLAVMLLTRLPAGRIEGDAPPLIAARWAFPLVGAGVGALGWAAHTGALALGAAPWVAALLAIAFLAVVTGALHFDGLADFADGIGGGRDRDHCLEIMRDSRIGSYGVLALIVAAGLWSSALAELGEGATLLWFAAAGAFSRAGIVILQETLPPARADGMGKLAEGRSVPARAVVAIVILAVVLNGAAGFFALLASGAAVLAVGALARRRIGGQTGDVLGAAQLVSEVVFWVALSMALVV